MEENSKLRFESALQSKSKVLVINPINSYWSYQLTCEAALRSRLISNSVQWINASKNEKQGFFINKTDHISRLKFINPQKKIESILDARGISVDFIDSKRKPDIDFNIFDSEKEFRSFEKDEIPYGSIIYSAVVSVKHSTNFDLYRDQKLISHFYSITHSLVQHLEKKFAQDVPDLLITTNDRLPAAAVSTFVAQKWGIPSSVIYWGCDFSQIKDYWGTLYDSLQWQRDVEKLWSVNPPNVEDERLLRSEIESLVHTPSADSQTFLSTQIRGQSIVKQRFTVVFYAQSEHEHSSIYYQQVQKMRHFTHQYAAFKELEKKCNELGYDLILKLHPNKFDSVSSLDQEAEFRDWMELDIGNDVKILRKDSIVDTYELINDADINVVWNSTVGLESIMRGKRTIVLGNAHWLNLDWGIHAWNADELDRLLSKDIPILTVGHLLPWFWYLARFGTPVKYACIDKGLTICGLVIIAPRFWFRICQSFNFFIKKTIQSICLIKFSFR